MNNNTELEIQVKSCQDVVFDTSSALMIRGKHQKLLQNCYKRNVPKKEENEHTNESFESDQTDLIHKEFIVVCSTNVLLSSMQYQYAS